MSSLPSLVKRQDMQIRFLNCLCWSGFQSLQMHRLIEICLRFCGLVFCPVMSICDWPMPRVVGSSWQLHAQNLLLLCVLQKVIPFILMASVESITVCVLRQRKLYCWGVYRFAGLNISILSAFSTSPEHLVNFWHSLMVFLTA